MFRLIFLIKKWTLPALVLAFGLCAFNSQAAYVQVFNTIQKGAITFTGNTLGLNSATASGQTAVFIASNLATSVPGYPAGTTSNYALSLSNAQLNMPAGSTVLYAELIWSGKLGGAITTGLATSTPVTFVTPMGTYSINSSASTASNSLNYYTRTANVTGLVQIGGAGTYKLGGAPALANTSATDGAGWTLAVAYAASSKPARNLTIFVGNELVSNGSPSAVAAVSGFCSPTSGPVNGRLAVSGIEGDTTGTGDSMLFGASSALTIAANAVSGPNNPATNFFVSQINGDTGTLDTSGSFGTANQPMLPAPGNSPFARQSYDITNVDVSSFLNNSQTTAFAQGTSTSETYAINALGLQIDVNSPVFPVSTKLVNHATTFVGDQLIYSVDLDNRGGNGGADSLMFYDAIPAGTTFVPNSFMIDTNPPLPNNPAVQTGVFVSGADPATGVAVGTVVPGSVTRVSFRVNVTALPATPAPARFDNFARWDYTYIACAGVAAQPGSVTTTTVGAVAARLEPSKTVSPTGALVGGQTATYTIVVPNTGLLDTAGTTLADPIPSGTTYVVGSTKLNGLVVADGPGSTMPFAIAAPINSPGKSAGLIAMGASSTVQFSVVATSGATVVNTANVDPDGPGPSPAIAVTAVNSGLSGPTVNKLFTPSSIAAGGKSTLTVTLTNPNATAITGASVADNLPGGMVIASPANATTTCAGGTVTGVPAGITLALTGGTIPANGSCAISADVTSSTPGTYVNTIPPGAVTSANAGANTVGSGTLTVTVSTQPAISKSFSPGTVAINAASTLTITLTNFSATVLTAASFTDTFPTSPGVMSLFSIPPTSNCGGALTDGAGATLAVGSTSIKLAGGTIPASGVCTISVQVQGSVGGSYFNTVPIGGLTSSGGANAAAAAATLYIASPQITKSFSPTTVAAGAVSTMTISLTNVTNTSMTGLVFTDNYPVGLVNNATAPTKTCSGAVTAANGSGSLALASTTLLAGASCTITKAVTAASAGSYTNTIGVGAVTSTSHGSNVVGTSASLNVGQPSISKVFSVATIPLNGTATLTITLTNPTNVAMSGAAFTDTLPAGLTASGPAGGTCVGTKTAAGSTVSLSSGTIPAAPTTCTVTATVTGVTIGLKTNTISAGGLTVTTPAPASNSTPTSATVTVLAPPTITKSFLSSPILPATGTSTLRILIENSNSVALTGTTFIDTFPTTPGAMTIADLTTSNSCGGSLVNNLNTALAIGNLGIRLNAATIPSNGNCVVTVNVKASLAGDYTNTIPASPSAGFLSTAEAGGNIVSASAVLAVRLAAPVVAKSFSPSTIVANAPATMTLTITNPSTTQAITGVAWSDIFPAGMKVFSTPAFANTCGGTVTAGSTANDTSLSINSATVPFNAGGTGTCSISVAVTSTVVAASPGLANTTGTVTSTNANTSATATANLIVTTPPLTSPAISKAFSPSSITSGGTSTITFSLSNANPGILTNANFTDTLTNMSIATTAIGGTCVGATNSPALVPGATGVNAVNLTVPNLPPGGCTVSVQVTSSTTGANPNTSSGVVTTQTPVAGAVSNTATLTVTLSPSLVFMKTVSVLSDPFNGGISAKNIPGAVVLYTLRVTNTGAGTVDSNTLIIADPIPANTELFVGDLAGANSGPIGFVQGTPTSALSWTYTALGNLVDDVDFSNVGCNTWTYVPTPPFDPAVNCIRLNPKGTMSGTGGGNPYFDLSFRVRIK
jgi:uncharacterized repeat protein (TIGR01451 family)